MLKQINKANKDEYFYNDLGRLMGGKFGQASYLNQTKSINNQYGQGLTGLADKLTVSQSVGKLPKLNNQVDEKEIQELEEELDLDMIDKALNQHAKRYDGKKEKPKSSDSNHIASSLPRIRKVVPLKDMNKEFAHTVSKNIIIIVNFSFF